MEIGDNMDIDKVLQKRVRGMSVRILACIEHTLACHLDGVGDDEKFAMCGSDLKIIRSEILNAAGDTTRSLVALLNENPPGKTSLSRDVIACLNRAELSFETVEDETIPMFTTTGDFNLLCKIRDQIKSGVVYDNVYACIGLDCIVESLMPFLDQAQFAGIKIADGDYKSWRYEVCQEYMGGLNDE